MGLVAVAATAVAAAAAAVPATATSAAAAISTATATATAAATTVPTTATAAAPVFAGTGFIDGQGAAVVLLPIEGCNRGFRLIIVRHFDEPKTLAPTGIPIIDHLGRQDLPVRPKQLLEFRAIHLVAQVPDVQLLSHCEISYEWLMTAPF